MVGVDQHHDIGPQLQGLAVASLLVGSVSQVLRVDEELEVQLPDNLHRSVPAGIVGQEDVVNDLPGDIMVSLPQGPFGVIGGHDDDDLLPAARGGTIPFNLEATGHSLFLDFSWAISHLSFFRLAFVGRHPPIRPIANLLTSDLYRLPPLPDVPWVKAGSAPNLQAFPLPSGMSI